MVYLHSSPLKSHGHLSSFNCLIDSRLVLKIAEHGLPSLMPAKRLIPPSNNLTEEECQQYMWRAPEHLRSVMPVAGTQKGTKKICGPKSLTILIRQYCWSLTGDVYSFSILTQQILLQSEPFKTNKREETREVTVNAVEIVLEVRTEPSSNLRLELGLVIDERSPIEIRK
jgi:guanylate cyclase 2F